jgi:hypothetical protein
MNFSESSVEKLKIATTGSPIYKVLLFPKFFVNKEKTFRYSAPNQQAPIISLVDTIIQKRISFDKPKHIIDLKYKPHEA